MAIASLVQLDIAKIALAKRNVTHVEPGDITMMWGKRIAKSVLWELTKMKLDNRFVNRATMPFLKSMHIVLSAFNIVFIFIYMRHAFRQDILFLVTIWFNEMMKIKANARVTF